MKKPIQFKHSSVGEGLELLNILYDAGLFYIVQKLDDWGNVIYEAREKS